MKERPILYSAPMVRAILEDRKTKTRRVVKMKHHHQIEQREDGTMWPWMYDSERNTDCWLPCPHGKPGDRLWVRESWRARSKFNKVPPRDIFVGSSIRYEADGYQELGEISQKALSEPWGRLRPGMFMPRWASRILLEIVSVRVDHLQDISADDARAEGCAGGYGSLPDDMYDAAPDEHFMHLWSKLNGEQSWHLNPWVWVIEFKVVKP